MSLLPNTVLAGALYLFIKREFGRFEADKRKTEQAIEQLGKAVVEMATRDMLGRLGDRFDARVALLEREAAVIQERLRK